MVLRHHSVVLRDVSAPDSSLGVVNHALDGELLRRRLASTTWHDTTVVEQVDSTNAELLRDPRPWRVILADHQTAARGRRDRAWEVPAGLGVALSVVLPLPADPTRWGWVPLLVGRAVVSAVRALCAVPVTLKWPNDVLARETPDGPWRKVAGILCSATGGDHPVVVAGIGLNVHQTRAQLPLDRATSLDLCGARVTREELTLAILEELTEIERSWDGPTLDDSYRADCMTLGQVVRIERAEGDSRGGTAVDIDPLGRLVLETSDGRVPHAVGDVVHVRPSQEPAGSSDDASRSSATDRAAFVDRQEERLMGFPRTLRRADVGAAAKVSQVDARRFWRALGFANARDEDVVFSPADVEALERVVSIVHDGLLDERTALGLARAIGRSTDRMAMWSLQLVTDMVSGERIAEVDDNLARVSAERTVELIDRLEPLVTYVFRRNVGVAISRMVADSEPETHIGVVRTVGFADLVSYTRLVRRLSERDLAALVLRFEALASDIVSLHGGAVVKTVGDEVLFSHTSSEGAVDIAFDLLEATENDEVIPQMRVGMASGRVLARLGDIYGTTVNRASRLTAIAQPNTVLVDPIVATEVKDLATVDARPTEEIDLRGIGLIEPWQLRRVDG